MLSNFDLLRQTKTGVELLALLKMIVNGFSTEDIRLNKRIPYSLLDGPCNRCWIYPRKSGHMYCEICLQISHEKKALNEYVRQKAVIWGALNQIPDLFSEINWKQKFSKYQMGIYIHNDNSFLMTIPKNYILNFLKQLTLRYGDELGGLLQIFPTSGLKNMSMGESICRAVHYEHTYPMDKFRIRFYSHPLQLNRPHLRDRKGMLTFEVSEFIGLLELTKIFRILLTPQQQIDLNEIITKCEDTKEEGFFWGRFNGVITQNAKDILHEWDIRHWPKEKFELIYELRDYVAFSRSD